MNKEKALALARARLRLKEQEERSALEGQMAEAEQGRMAADRNLEAAEDSIGENLLEGAGELAAGVNRAVVGGADILTSPVRAAYNELFAKEGEELNSVADLFPEGYRPGQGGFIEEQPVQDAVGTIGEGVAMGAGFANVNRAESAGSFVLEMLGAGQTQSSTDLVKQASEALRKADGQWEDVGGRFGIWEDYATGVSDGIRREISPELGGRVQRADETAMRMRTLDTKEFIENADMQRVINLAETDKKFKGLMLDFGQNATDQASVFKYVRDNLDDDAAQALSKYFKWSWQNNAKYNKRLGKRQSAVNYLHTQKTRGLPGSAPIAKAESPTDYIDFKGDDLNMPTDQATKDRTRGLASKGEVNVDEYANPFLTNANRIFNNRRLMELQDKIGIGDLDGGAEALMKAIEKKTLAQGIGEQGARDARNAIALLIKGQNKSANAWIKSFQNSGYTVLAGPKTVLLNLHDIPVAAWNNGISSAQGLLKSKAATGADVERLGIDGQNVGEFVQAMRTSSKKRGWGEKAEAITSKITDKAMTWGGFATVDRMAKNQVLKMVADDTKKRVIAGTLRQRWGSYFEPAEMARLEGAVKRTGGDITKMNKKEQKLYDELITLGLGQQQLISAAGRPPNWLANPNARPLWMMRGFAIKHNALLTEKVVKKLKSGDKTGAAKEAAMYLALPGSAFAAMNVGRNEMFKEDYEATGEEFMYSLLDSVLGPVTLNSIGFGTAFERDQMTKSTSQSIAESLIPPMGLYGDVIDSVGEAVGNQDVDKLGDIVSEHPLFKQWAAFFD